MKLLIKNGIIAGERRSDVLLQDGIITRIDENIPSEGVSEVLDAKGGFIIPGLVDICTEICDPGYENRENIQSLSRCAVKGGYTSLASQSNTDPPVDNMTLTNYVVAKSKRHSEVNIFPCGNMTTGNGERISEIGEMLAEGIVAISDGGESVADAGLMLNILKYSRMFNIPVIVSCEDKSLAGRGQINHGHMSTVLGLRGVPREAEELMVARNLLLARDHNPRLHIWNISTRGSVELVRSYKRGGMQVTCGTCPHYFSLTEDALESYDSFAKVRPPLRTKDDLEHIIEGIADGTIDCISSGHSPVTIDSKSQEFDRASCGISSLETAFSLGYTALVAAGHISLTRLIECMSQNPARILGLKSKGSISVGCDGDLCVVSPGSYRIDGAGFASLAKFTPYQGREVLGEIIYTLVGGRVVYQHGR